MKRKCREEHVERIEKLQSIPGLSAQQIRQISRKLSQDDSGARMLSSQAARHESRLPILTELAVPGQTQKVFVLCCCLPDLVQAKVDSSEDFAASLEGALKKNGGRLHLICYSDEATPGNVLAPVNNRKSMLSYCTFLELPELYLTSFWLTLSVVRTSQVNKCQNGFASILRCMLERIHKDVQYGFPVDFKRGNGPQLIFVPKVIILGDHEQLRQSIGNKGASGTKPCFKCSNVLSLGHSDIPRHTTIAEHDLSKCAQQTHKGVLDILSHLRSLPTKTKREQHETLLGWNLAAATSSFLSSDELSGFADFENCYYDGMHGYFSNGVVNQELGLWFTAIRQNTPASLTHLQQYCSALQLANQEEYMKPVTAADFSEKLWRLEMDLKADASKCWTLLRVCVQFGEELLRPEYPELGPQLDSLKALYYSTQALLKTKSNAAFATELKSLQTVHARLFAKAYPLKQRPKLHFNMHLPDQVIKWGRYLDAFACERKHKQFKQVAVRYQELGRFERGVLLEMLSQELLNTQHGIDKPVLSGPHTQSSSLAEALGCKEPVLVARHLQASMAFSSGDFLMLSADKAVQVVCGATVKSESLLLVEELTYTKQNGIGSIWTRSGKQSMLETSGLDLSHRVAFVRSESKSSGAAEQLLLLP